MASSSEDRVVIYGGFDPSGALNRSGVVIDGTSSYRPFSTEEGLVDVTIAEVGTQIYLAGRACGGQVESTDIGYQCSPNVPKVYRLDLATMSVTTEFDDQLTGLGARDVARVHPLDGGVVLERSGDGPPGLWMRGSDGDVTELPAWEAPVDCSTGDALYASNWAGVTPMTDEAADRGEAPMGPGPGLVRLRTAAGTWEEIAEPAGGFTFGDRMCARGRVTHVPVGGAGTQWTVLDEVDGVWSTIDPRPDGFGSPPTFSNVGTDHVVASEIGGLFDIDLSTGKTAAIEDPALVSGEARTLGTDAITMGADGRLRYLSASLTIEAAGSR